MPRRTGQRALDVAQKELALRWRLIIRNQAFQDDLRLLRRDTQNNRAFFKEQSSFAKKWRLVSGPPYNLLISKVIPELSADTVALYDTLLDSFGSINEAVTSYDEFAGPYDEWHPPSGISQTGERLCLSVDLSYPLDVLMALVESQLREAIQDSKVQQNKSRLVSRPLRLRLDNVDFQLAVFDLVQCGNTFSQVSKQLAKKTSTIKGRLNTIRSAYLAAMRKIDRISEMNPPNSSRLHNCEKCAVCSKAQRPEQFCPSGKRDFECR